MASGGDVRCTLAILLLSCWHLALGQQQQQEQQQSTMIRRQRCWLANECDALLSNGYIDCRPTNACERFCAPLRNCFRPPLSCYCRKGFARNRIGECVPLTGWQCSLERRMVAATTHTTRATGVRVTPCPDTECASSQPSCRCEAFCRMRQRCTQNPTGCHCARGYARDQRNVCVPLNTCRLPITVQ